MKLGSKIKVVEKFINPQDMQWTEKFSGYLTLTDDITVYHHSSKELKQFSAKKTCFSFKQLDHVGFHYGLKLSKGTVVETFDNGTEVRVVLNSSNSIYYLGEVVEIGREKCQDSKKYFQEILNKILSKVPCNIPIIIKDHSMLHQTNKKCSKEALGCCHRINSNIKYITIDEDFVIECYEYFITKTSDVWLLNSQTLEEVICHELAHLIYWRHGKLHTNLTKKYLKLIGE